MYKKLDSRQYKRFLRLSPQQSLVHKCMVCVDSLLLLYTLFKCIACIQHPCIGVYPRAQLYIIYIVRSCISFISCVAVYHTHVYHFLDACMRIHVRTYVCMYVCINICMHACMNQCSTVHESMCMNQCSIVCVNQCSTVHESMYAVCIASIHHVCMYVCMHACMYACVVHLSYACMHVCVCVFACISPPQNTPPLPL